MPDSTKNNNGPDPKKASSQESRKREHETHTTSLVLLAIATLVVIVVVLTFNQEVNNLNPGTYNDQQVQVDQESHGAVIPTEQVQTQKQTNLTGFPEGMYLPEDREIVRNFSADLTESTRQRVVIFDTGQSMDQFRQKFGDSLKTTSFQFADSSSSQKSSSLRVEDGNQKMIVNISEHDGQRRVQVNYLTEK